MHERINAREMRDWHRLFYYRLDRPPAPLNGGEVFAFAFRREGRPGTRPNQN